MKQSTIFALILMILGGGYLVFRVSTSEMGKVYVRDVEVKPEGAVKTWTKEEASLPKDRNEPEVRLSWSRTIGLWVAALCTLSIFSFLYGDNPLYKFAEAVFVGSSAGYAMVIGFWDGIIKILFLNILTILRHE